MRKKHQRWLCIALMIFMVLSALPTVSWANANRSVEDVSWSVSTPLVQSNTSLTVQFNISSEGALSSSNGDTISLELESSWVIPSSISLENIWINQQPIGSQQLSISGNTMVLPLPANATYGNGETMVIDILEEAGVQTPNQAGDYDAKVATSQDQLQVASNKIQIESQISQPLVALSNYHVNKVSAYEAKFRLADTPLSGLDGSRNLNTKNSETISLQFPSGTTLPSSISNSFVKLNGELIDSAAGNVQVDQTNRIVTIPVPTKLSINQNGFAQVEINESAGIQNPDFDGNYTLNARTTRDTAWQTSSSYSILDSIISVPEVTVSPTITGKAGAYFITFRVSSNGALAGNQDKVFVRFPQGTTLPSSISRSYIEINGTTLTNSPTINGQELRFTIPSSLQIKVGEEVRVNIYTQANIQHPNIKGNYSLVVRTSQDTVENISTLYQIDEAVQKVEVWPSPNTAGQMAQYSIALTNGSQNLLGSEQDKITIRFPTGTTLPSTMSRSQVFLNGEAIPDQQLIQVNQQARTVMIQLPSQMVIPANEYVSILFDELAGINNPLKQGSYQLEVKSTKEPAYRASTMYDIGGNRVNSLSVQVFENGKGLDGEYLVQFKVSALGGLVGGQDTIMVAFPEGTTVPSSINRSAFQINDKNLDANVIVLPNRTIRLTVPTEVVIPKSGDVKVKINPSSGIKNPTQVGLYTIEVYTSRDPVAVTSNPYDIGQQISNVSISLSPNTYNVAGQYAIGFYTSSLGGLSSASNEYVELVFPQGTRLPSSISSNNVTINGKNVSSIQVNQQSMKLYLPTGMDVEAGQYVGVVLNDNAGVRNPSASSSHQVKVRTSKDTSFVHTPRYSTRGSSPQPTTNPDQTSGSLTIKLSSELANAKSKYELYYRTSSSGALKGGEDEITITFTSDVTLPDFISRELIKINGVPVDNGLIRRIGNAISFRLPTTVDIRDNQQVLIEIDQLAEIRNPKVAGTYPLFLMTTKDTGLATGFYQVTGDGTQAFTVIPEYNDQNKIDSYTLTFKTSDTGRLQGGFDWISLALPTGISRGVFLENVKLSVNGYQVANDMIQVSGPTIIFLLPSQVTIGHSSQALILIEDKEHFLMPSKTGTYTFQISSSKDSSWMESNNIVFSTSGEGSSSDDNPNSPGEGNSDDNPNSKPTIPDSGAGASNSNQIKLYLDQLGAMVNSSQVTLDAAPQLIDGHTMVPLRFVSEQLGGEVDYRPDQRRILILMGDDYLLFTLDSNTVYTKTTELKLPSPPKLINGRTFVPLRFISEQLGMDVTWNSTDRSITLKKKTANASGDV
jgi:hypothetical protein